MLIGEWNGQWGYRILDRQGKVAEELLDSSPDNHLADFVDSVRSRRVPSCGILEGRLSTAMCHLGNICVRTGRPLRLNPHTGEIQGDDEASRLAGRSYRRHWATPPEAAGRTDSAG